MCSAKTEVQSDQILLLWDCSGEIEGSLDCYHHYTPSSLQGLWFPDRVETLEAVIDAKMERCYRDKSDFQAETQSMF